MLAGGEKNGNKLRAGRAAHLVQVGDEKGPRLAAAIDVSVDDVGHRGELRGVQDVFTDNPAQVAVQGKGASAWLGARATVVVLLVTAGAARCARAFSV